MRARYFLLPWSCMILTGTIAAVLPRNVFAEQPAATQPAGAASSRPAAEGDAARHDAEQRKLGRADLAEQLLRQNENAIRRALNDDNYSLAMQRASASRQILDVARADLGAQRHGEWTESLAALGRIIDDGLARQAADAAGQRIAAAARQRSPKATTQPAEAVRPADMTVAALQEPAGSADTAMAPRENFREMPVVSYPDAETWKAISRRETSREEDERVARSRRALARRQASIEYAEGTPLGQAVDSLRRDRGLCIDANWGVLSRAGIERNTPTQGLRLNDVRTDTALQLMLDDVGGAAGVPLGYVIVDGVVWISTIDDLNTKRYIKVYDVSDLLFVARSFRAPTDILNGGSSSGGGLFSGGVNTTGNMNTVLPTQGR